MGNHPLSTCTSLVVAALLAVGCSKPFYVGTDGARIGTDRAPPPASAAPDPRARRTGDSEMSRRPVSGKEPPATLVARDGARCLVTSERFAEIREGEKVWCAWRRGDR